MCLETQAVSHLLSHVDQVNSGSPMQTTPQRTCRTPTPRKWMSVTSTLNENQESVSRSPIFPHTPLISRSQSARKVLFPSTVIGL